MQDDSISSSKRLLPTKMIITAAKERFKMKTDIKTVNIFK